METIDSEQKPAAPGRSRQFIGLALWLAICYGIAALGGYLTSQGLGPYYQTLAKPDWTPPGYVIGIIWQVLYGLMAVSALLVWRRTGWRHPAIALFLVQLLLNLGWSYVFFVMKCPENAFYELCVLWVSILATAILFWPVSRIAAALLIPYLAWVAFAGFLNYTIWQMN
ncbi:MAG TPA: tryptophan-rich sensory protein [Gemmatales bacterium]|nr:tryptophan-rich sensory protein [Gemmatales bacterium]